MPEQTIPSQEIMAQLEKIPERKKLTRDELAQIEKSYAKLMGTQGTLAEAAGIDPEIIDYAYGEAYRFLQSGNLQEAKHLFSMLNFLAPCDRHLIALGTVYYLLNHYEMATGPFLAVVKNHPERADLFFQLYDCYTQMDNQIGQLIALKKCIEACDKNPKFKMLKSRAELCLETLKMAIKGEK